MSARLLIVGLAPGLRGANCTGRPFTGDHAGRLLYPTLLDFGFATGSYGAHRDDGLRLIDCRVTNAVRCVPPENQPTSAEIKTCGRFLDREISDLPRLRVIMALGAIAHGSILVSLGLKRSHWPFAHGTQHRLPNGPSPRRSGSGRAGGLILADCYHCSRYNLNTGRLTEEMFQGVVAAVRDTLAARS